MGIRTNCILAHTSRCVGGLVCAAVLGLAAAASGNGSAFYENWAGEVGGGPDLAWGAENATDPNNSNVHYYNTTPAEATAAHPTTLEVIDDPTSPTGRALQMTILPDPNFASNGIYQSAKISTKLSARGQQCRVRPYRGQHQGRRGPRHGRQLRLARFWMLGDNISSVGWPACGEVDIMESKGSQPTVNYSHLHGPTASGGDYNGGAGVGGSYTLPGGATLYGGYHTYGAWIGHPANSPGRSNGVDYLTETPTSSNFVNSGGTWVFDGHPFYLIFDICQGGPFASTGHNITEPLNMDIAYVNVCQPGDANGDGRVDINDLTVVLANYDQTGMGWTQGDFTNDGTVDINDLTIVLANYNWTAASAGMVPVPEPASAVLLSIAAAGCWSSPGDDGRSETNLAG